MPTSDYTFAELVDLPALQEMLTSLYEIAQIPVAIMDLAGNLLAAAGWQNLCSTFHRPQPELEKICLASELFLQKEMRNGIQSATYHCPHGLIDACVPITLEGKHLANAFTGQLLHAPLSASQRQRLQNQAQQYGFPEAEYLAALSELPVISSEKHQALLALLRRFGEQIAQIGLTHRRTLAQADQLRASEEKYRLLVEGTTDLITRIDQEGHILYINHAAETIFGLTPEECLGRSLFDFIHPEDRELSRNHCTRMIAEQSGSGSFENRHLSRQGKISTLLWTCNVEYDSQGRVKFIDSIGRDITNRRQAEEELRERESRFRHYFEHSSGYGLVFEIVDHDLIIVDANQAACAIHGYTRAELIGQSITLLSPDQSGTKERVRKVLAGELFTFETSHRRKDGSTFPVEVSPKFIAAGDKRYIYSIEHDLTDRKRSEAEISRHQAEFEAIFRAITDGVVFVDLQRRILMVNPAFCHIFGYRLDELQGRTTEFLYADPQEYLQQGRTRFNQDAVITQPVYEVEFRRRDGRTFPCEMLGAQVRDKNGKVIGFLGVLRDISSRKEAERHLVELEERFRLAFYTSPDAITINRLDGTYLEVNEGFCKITGYCPEEVVGKSTAELKIWHNPADRERLLAELNQHQQISNMEACLVMKDGSQKTALISAKIIMLHGEPHILEISRDITQIKSSEAEKKRIESQLRQAQKMEAIGTLAGGIAHDFNNILTAILGYTEMAKSEVAKDSLIASDLQEVLKAGNRAKNLVTQILAFSRQAAVEPIPIQLPTLIKEAIKLLRPSIPTTIAIQTAIEPTTALIMADPTQINQLLMNLCTNAFHAMEKTGGRLEIGLHEMHLGPAELADEPELSPGHYLQLSVRDTGPGIAPEIQERIFDPYFTTKEMGKGTGLGLAIVHGLAQSYGGFVQVTSSVGGGATFQVYLPVYRHTQDDRSESGDDSPTGNESILLVDDEVALTKLGKEMLEKLGYRVTVSNSSPEALELFRQDPSQYDLVITDQTMPSLTGGELARALLQIRPDLPIILCTGYSTIITEGEALELGIREFAYKPLMSREIAELIRKVLDGGNSPQR